MQQEALCPNCNEPTDQDAIYCGNCGFHLNRRSPLTSSTKKDLMPAYSKIKIYHRKHWPAYSVIFGIVGIAGSLLIPAVGLALGVLAIILSTSSIKKVSTRKYQFAGFLLGLIAIILAVLSIVMTIGQNTAKSYNLATSSVYVSTPCYTIKFSTMFNFNKQNKNSCNLVAYYGLNFNQSSQIYKINASLSKYFTATNLNNLAQTAIASDLLNLKGYTIIKKGSTKFNNSPAYYMKAYNASTDSSVTEEIVYHPSPSSKNNLFVIVYVNNSKTNSLNAFEKAFAWKY